MLVGELLCRAVDVHAGERVLDVAAGSAALAAAARGRRGPRAHTELADAQALPFDDAAFVVVLSTSARCARPTSNRSQTS